MRTIARLLLWAVVAVFAYKMVRVTWLLSRAPLEIDFYFFWDAARQVVSGQALDAYSARATPVGPIEPFAYPPPLLLLIWPLGLVGYGTAIVLWIGVTGAMLWAAARARLALLVTNPPDAFNLHFGQSGFLTSAFFLGGMNALQRRPRLAGALLGMVVVKPQLGLLIPLALAAGGYWLAFAFAALSASIMVALSGVAFGPEIYAAWWDSLSHYAAWLVSGYWPWRLLASVYGMLRWGGLSSAAAMAGHVAIAIGAALLVFKSWREQWSSKVAVVAAATLLASPYLFTYDAVLLIAPLAWLWPRAKGAALIIWGIALVPLSNTTFLGRYPFQPWMQELPSTIPVAALFALAMLTRIELRAKQPPAPNDH